MQLLKLQDRINELMSIFVAQVKGSTAMGKTDINKIAETFLVPLLKEVYGYAELKNLNIEEQNNYPAVDLGDEVARVAIQITSTPDSDKIKDTLNCFVRHELYTKFDHLIIYILTEKQKTYFGRGYQDIIQGRFRFDKDIDIRDYRDLLSIISSFQVDQLNGILSHLESNIGAIHLGNSICENIPYIGAEKFFVGRDKELETLHKLLLSSKQSAVAAISGMGGVGKTELAIQYAKRHLQLLAHHSGGVCWIDAREGDIGSQILRFARSHLSLNTPDNWDFLTQLDFCWRNWLPGDWLVVIDDVSDKNYNRQVQPYLPPSSKQFKVLLTSRIEISSPIKNLPLKSLHLDTSLELLRLLIGSERIQAEIDDAQAICERLGHLPLGLELIGRYLARDIGLSLQSMLNLLEKQKLKLKAIHEVDAHAPMTARYGVEAAFNLSWERLSENAKLLGCLLSLFALADIPWSLVEMVGIAFTDDNEINQILLQEARVELVMFNLLQAVDGHKYRLHQLIREFFKVHLTALEEANLLKQRFVVIVSSLSGDLLNSLNHQQILDLQPIVPHLKEIARDKNKDLKIYVEDEIVVAPFLGLGQFYKSQGLYQQAAQWLEEFLRLAEERFDFNHTAVFLGLNHLALTYSFLGRYSEAEALCQRFLEYEAAEKKPELVASMLGNLAIFYQGQGRYQEAENLLNKSLELKRPLFGENSLSVAADLNNLSQLCEIKGDLNQAEDLCKQALKIKKLHPEDQISDIEVATSLNNLANIYESQGRYNEAETFYEESLALRQKSLGENHPDTAQTLNNLAYLYKSMSKYERAEALFLESLQLREKILGDNHIDVAQTLNNLADLYTRIGQFTKAEAFLEKALKIRQEVLGSSHHKTIDCQLGLDLLRKFIKFQSGGASKSKKKTNKIRNNAEGFGKK